MQRLAALDSAFLYGETPAWHMHVAALVVADPSTTTDGFDPALLQEIVVSRLPLVPQFRWKLVDVPFGLDRPGWVEDDAFDPEYHIRCIGVPRPGGPRELGRLVGELVSYKLDRRRPLWEMWIIDGLDRGRVALLTKMHHSIIDGVSGMSVAPLIMDPSPMPRHNVAIGDTVQSLSAQRVPGTFGLVGRGVWNTLSVPWRVARYGVQLASWGLTLGGTAQHHRMPALPFTAPPTPFNGEITPHRRVAFASVPLARAKMVKNAFGVKLNDVVLALCAGAMREYVETVGTLPTIPMVASVPVSVRGVGGDEVGTKVSVMFTSLATEVDDPGERVAAIAAGTRNAKEMQQALAAKRSMGLTDTTPPGFISLAARAYAAMGLDARTPPVFNAVISNVAGPTAPLYLAGARVEQMLPMGPLLYGVGLNITALSYVDAIDFGIQVCPELVPEPELIAHGMEHALVELEKAAAALT